MRIVGNISVIISFKIIVQLYLGNSIIYTLDELESFINQMQGVGQDELLTCCRDGRLVEWLLEGDEELQKIGITLKEFLTLRHEDNEILEKVMELFKSGINGQCHQFEDFVEYLGCRVATIGYRYKGQAVQEQNDNSALWHELGIPFHHQQPSMRFLIGDGNYMKSRVAMVDTSVETIEVELGFKILKPVNDKLIIRCDLISEGIKSTYFLNLSLDQKKDECRELFISFDPLEFGYHDVQVDVFHGCRKLDMIQLVIK